jgi:hypothetical protein
VLQDFLDEDALSEPSTLAQYKLILLTEPNVPKVGLAGLIAWAEAGGTLAAVSAAGSADEYNTPSSVLSQTAGVSEEYRTRLIFSDDNTLENATKSTSGELSFTAFGVASGLKIGATLDDVAPKTLATYEDGSIAATETTV